MASEKDSNAGTKLKWVLIVLTGILTTVLFIGSIVMITIGYMNPFGTVGLGILGGGCVTYFSALLLLCTCSIYIKNKYYPEETDYGETLKGISTEDVSLLKPSSNVFSSEQPVHDSANRNGCYSDENPVAVYSVSTIYSSLSSSASLAPEKLLQGHGKTEDLDLDVFSSSPPAFQHCDMKSQQNLELRKNSAELLARDCAVQKVQYQWNQHANTALHNNGKSVSDLPRQRQPVFMDVTGDLSSTALHFPHRNIGKHEQNPRSDVKSAVKEETPSSTNKELFIKKPQLGPMKNTQQKTTVPHDYKGDLSKCLHEKGVKHCPQVSSQEMDQAPNNRNIRDAKPGSPPERYWSTISESDFVMPLTTSENKQGIASKVLPIVSAADLQNREIYAERTDKYSQGRTVTPFQFFSPKTQEEQHPNNIFSQATKVEGRRDKFVINKQTKPATRTDQ